MHIIYISQLYYWEYILPLKSRSLCSLKSITQDVLIDIWTIFYKVFQILCHKFIE